MDSVPDSLPVLKTQDTKRLLQSALLGKSAIDLLRSGMNTPTFLGLLQTGKLAYDTINVLTHSLPKNEAVLWAVKSLEMVKGLLARQDLRAAKAAQT